MIVWAYTHPILILTAYALLAVGFVVWFAGAVYKDDEVLIQEELEELEDCWSFPEKWSPGQARTEEQAR